MLAQISATGQDASPAEWRTYVNRGLVPEIKQEAARFYGGLEDPESLYPGLDYFNPNHRLRLQTFPHHAKLFKAMDALRLTETEVYALCKWHGSKKAKFEHERRHGIKIRDTTWEGVHNWCPQEPTVTHCLKGYEGVENRDTSNQDLEDDEEDMETHPSEQEENSEATDSDDGLETSVQHSAGTSLNERLLAHAEAHTQARARGELVEINADWEEWMKQTLESHGSQDDLRAMSSEFVAELLQRQQDTMTMAPFANPSTPQLSHVEAGLPLDLSQSQAADGLETTTPARGSTAVGGN